MLIDFDYATPKFKAANREQARKIILEYARFESDLRNVEYDFLIEVFDGEEHTYQEAYELYHEQWTYAVNRVKKIKQPKFWTINENYFSNTYKPKENENFSTYPAILSQSLQRCRSYGISVI